MKINATQYVGLEKEAIEFKNYFKHMPISVKIYADFERNLKSVESYEGFHSKKKKKKNQNHIPCSFAYKRLYVVDEFTQLIIVFRGEKAADKFIKFLTIFK